MGFLFAAARWHIVLRLSRCNVHGGATIRTVLIGHLFNTILFGPTGGDIAKAAWYARWYGFPVPSILATCMLDRSIGGAGFLFFAVLAPGLAAYNGQWLQRAKLLLSSPRLALGAAVLVLLSLLALALRPRLRWPMSLRRLTDTLTGTANQLLRQPRQGLTALVFALFSHLCISCVFLFSLEAVTHTRFSLAALFWIFPVISLVTAAPITFAGAGLREGAALVLLGLYGIPAADAVAASLLVLVTYMAWAVVAGVLLWRAQALGERASRETAQSISVVIPALNEAAALEETVRRARAVPEVTEIIVVDGGSADATVELGRSLGCRVLECSTRGRGAQLRLGAEAASGDAIVLLHADTWLPARAGEALLRCLRDPLVVGGGFWKVFRERHPLMAGSRLRCGLRLLLFRRVLGDQAMFVRRKALELIGGVPDLPLMEEFELCWRLRARGRLALAGATVITSARRFIQAGVLRTYLRMGHVTLKYYLGTPARELSKLYERE
jgi:rSAM/selenodomain-associated transferase 2